MDIGRKKKSEIHEEELRQKAVMHEESIMKTRRRHKGERECRGSGRRQNIRVVKTKEDKSYDARGGVETK